MRRLLVAACAALALALACVTGELRGSRALDDDVGSVASATDMFEALPPIASVQPSPPPSGGGVFLDPHFPPSRLATADVFRPPQARS
jgi:hypothetical protein